MKKVRVLFPILFILTSFVYGQNYSLISPKEGSSINTNIIFFNWNNYNNSQLNFKVAYDEDFEDLFHEQTISQSSLNVNLNIDTNTVLFWGIFDLECNLLSEIWSFDAFKPDSISGLLFWLNNNDGINLDEDGYLIEWTDQGPSNLVLSQSVSSRRPLKIESPFDCYYFDGGDRFEGFSLNVGSQYSIYSIVQRPFNDAIISAQNGGYFLYDSYHNTGGYSFDLGFDMVSDTFMIENLYRNDTLIIRKENLIQDGILNSSSNLEFEIDNIGGPGPFRLNGYIAEILIANQVDSIENLFLENYFKSKYSPKISIGMDLIIKNLCDTTLMIQYLHGAHLWSNGSQDSIIVIDEPGTYWIDVIDIFGFHSSDTILVHYPGNYLKSFSLCSGQDSIWDTQLNKQDYTFLWQDGSADSVMVMDQPGEYYCSITSIGGCIYDTDTVVFSWDNYSTTTHLPSNPTTLCANGILSLEAGAEETISYEWYSDASPTFSLSSEAFIVPDSEQNYWVVAENEIGCVAVDSTFVTLIVGTPTPIPGFLSELACSNQSILFSDTSIQEEVNISQWEWSTSDGQISPLQNPNFTFNDYGEVIVSLKVINDVGCSAFTSETIRVHPSPEVALIEHDNLCTNTSLSFSDSSTIAQGNITSWTWVVDGDTIIPDGALNQLNYPFEEGGEHELLQLVTSDSGCVSELTTLLNLRETPISFFTYNTVCIGTPVTLSASDTSGAGPVFFEWIDLNGEYLGGTQLLTIATGDSVYPSGNIQYPLTLITHTSDSYCSDTLTHYFRFEALPEVQIIRDQACQGETVNLSATAGGGQDITSWNWELENGSTSDEEDFSFIPSDTGYVGVSLLSSTQFLGCETLVEDSIRIYPIPQANFSGDNEGCINSDLLFEAIINEADLNTGLGFEWLINESTLSIDSSITLNLVEPGPFQLTLSMHNAGNCESNIQNEIQVFGALVNIEYEQVCEGNETNLLAVPDTTYSGPTISEWILESGESIIAHNFSIDLGSAGMHWVINTIIDIGHNCIDTDTVEVKVSDWPLAQFQASPVCEGEEFSLISDAEEGNDPINSSSWLVPDGSEVFGEELNYSFANAGLYTIQLNVTTLEAACHDSIIQEIEVQSLPVSDFTFSPQTGQVPLNVNFENLSDTVVSYIWYFGENSISVDPSPNYTFIDSGWVAIRLVSESLIGCTGEKMDSIYVDPPRIDIEVVEVIPEWDGDFVSIKARVKNNGYYTVTEFESLTTFGTTNPFKKIEQIVIPGEDSRITDPSSSWYFDPSTGQAFACVEVSLADGTKDEVPGNDKACVALSNDKFIVYDPFPNPGSDLLNIRMILPEDGKYSVEIYSYDGKMVLGESYNGEKGFNQLQIETGKFTAGNYSVRIRFGEKEKTFSWVKN